MALSNSDLDKIAGGGAFLSRAKIAIATYARDVQDEATSVAFHSDRVALANRFAIDPGNMTSKLAVLVVTDPAVINGTLVGSSQPTYDTDQTDATLYAIVNARWNKWFGVL